MPSCALFFKEGDVFFFYVADFTTALPEYRRDVRPNDVAADLDDEDSELNDDQPEDSVMGKLLACCRPRAFAVGDNIYARAP